jgi:PIN domain
VDVVLDANILCEDFLLSGKNFRIFWGEAPRIPARVFIPQVAFDETINKYRERLEFHASESIKLARNVGYLLKRKLQPYLDESSVPELVEAYKSQIQAKLSAAGVTVLPYPKISHEEVVRRDLARLRPFRAGGAGYRDTLIWETVISLCRSHEAAKTVLVTRNERDFGRGPDILGEMEAELAKRIINPKRLMICCGLDNFNSTFIMPGLESLAVLKERFAAHGMVRRFFAGGDFEFAAAWIPSTISIRFSLFFSPGAGNAESAELDAIEGETGSIEINRVPRSDT